MKLAELLNERKAVKEEIKKVKERLYLSAKMQEGDAAPVESPEELRKSLIVLYQAQRTDRNDKQTLVLLLTEKT